MKIPISNINKSIKQFGEIIDFIKTLDTLEQLTIRIKKKQNH